jgi:hypothetical protein
MQQSDFIAWLRETFKRLALKSPKFFQVYQSIGMIAVVVGFIPDALTFLEITPTDVMNQKIQLAMKIAGAVMWFMAKMPVTDPRKPVDGKTGEAQALHDVMPFTQKVKDATPVVPMNQNPSA